MKVEPCRPRNNWQGLLSADGVPYHHTATANGLVPYWDESHAYLFEAAEHRELLRAAEDVQGILLEALQAVLEYGTDDDVARLGVRRPLIPAARMSWEQDWPLVTARFDFSYDGRSPARLLEYNADNSYLGPETAIAQRNWRTNIGSTAAPFGLLHSAERMFASLADWIDRPLWFLHESVGDDEDEALMNAAWLRDAAASAGLHTRLSAIEALRWDAEAAGFCVGDQLIRAAHKTYSTRHVDDLTARRLAKAMSADDPMIWLNPPYATALGSKNLMALAWRMYAEHPNLLPTYAGDRHGLTSYARKPGSGHDSLGVSLVVDGKTVAGASDPLTYPDRDAAFQQLAPLADLGHGNVVVSVWTVGAQAVDVAIRETDGLLSYGDRCRFVPCRVGA